jgi:hypothetical protein
MEVNYRAKKLFIQAVSEQLQSPESPYVKVAYDRLIAEGLKKEAVMKMLGAVLALEMWEMKVQKRGFNEPAYIERLNSLPDTIWLDEE